MVHRFVHNLCTSVAVVRADLPIRWHETPENVVSVLVRGVPDQS